MLTGQNGILNRAGEAKEETERSQQEELEKLARMEALTNLNGYEYQGVNIPAGYVVSSREGENSLKDGLVIKDASGNEFVWVEVPRTKVQEEAQKSGINYNITNTTLTQTDYDTIEAGLKAYASPYTEGKKGQGYNWTDEWYDYYGTTYDGEHGYSQVKLKFPSYFDDAKTYYGAIYTDTGLTVEATDYKVGKEYYAKIVNNLNHKDGCGLTYEEYKRNKEKMLKSIYEKEGFWISRYEIGDEEETKNNKLRTGSNNPLTTPVSKQNQVPYIWLACSQAQELASKIAQGNTVTSSLLFGIQWDLMCKYLEGKDGLTEAKINENSSTWGNYKDSEIILNRGKYTEHANDWFKYEYSTDTEYVTKGKKVNNKTIILTTGASDDTKKQNIYDIAGNYFEYTLEHATYAIECPCAERGSCYLWNGDQNPASNRFHHRSSCINGYVGFRIRTLLNVALCPDSDTLKKGC